jgi:hypothetical protein
MASSEISVPKGTVTSWPNTAGAPSPLTTVLLIHGVGDALKKRSRDASERQINARCGEGRRYRYVWYDWNEAIPPSDPVEADYLRAVAYGMRMSARLEFPLGIHSGIRGWLWRLESTVSQYQLPVMSLFLLSCLWLAVAWGATQLHQAPPPLKLSLRATSLLFPPLDAVLLERSMGAARCAVGVLGLFVWGVIPALQIIFTVLSGRVPFRVALRCAVVDVARPLLAVLTTPAQFVLALLLMGVLLGVWQALTSRTLEIVDSHGEAVGERGGLGLLAVPLAFVGSGLVIWLANFLLRRFLKVVSDVMSYLGNPQYREGIHAHLLKKLTELDPGPILLVAHSLGSVIAVDSLLAHPQAWSRFRRVRLLTCGSPLKRLFHRFFPLSYPAPEILAGLMARTYGDFEWANVFRPLDYVGKRLGNERIVESRLHQRWHLHVGYWNDRQFAEIVAEQARRISTESSSAAVPAASAVLRLDRFRYGQVGGERQFGVLRRVLFPAGCVLLAVTQMIYVPKLEGDHLKAWSHRLESEGLAVQGFLCPQGEIARGDPTRGVADLERAVAGVQFQTLDGQTTRVAGYDDSRPDIDWDKAGMAVFGRKPESVLKEYLRGSVGLQDPLSKIRACKPVMVRYARSDPGVFFLPEQFRTAASSSGVITRAWRTIVLLIMWYVWWRLVSNFISAVLGGRKDPRNVLKQP